MKFMWVQCFIEKKNGQLQHSVKFGNLNYFGKNTSWEHNLYKLNFFNFIQLNYIGTLACLTCLSYMVILRPQILELWYM